MVAFRFFHVNCPLSFNSGSGILHGWHFLLQFACSTGCTLPKIIYGNLDLKRMKKIKLLIKAPFFHHQLIYTTFRFQGTDEQLDYCAERRENADARGTSLFFLAFELASSSATFSNNCLSSIAAHSYMIKKLIQQNKTYILIHAVEIEYCNHLKLLFKFWQFLIIDSLCLFHNMAQFGCMRI